jgi:hypothetical protein
MAKTAGAGVSFLLMTGSRVSSMMVILSPVCGRQKKQGHNVKSDQEPGPKFNPIQCQIRRAV